jgi:preprotein translocase subunit SecE
MAVDDGQTEDGSAYDEAAGQKTLGLERWVQFAFIGAALIGFYLFDKIIHLVWDFFQEPDPTLVTASAAALALLISFLCYRNPKVHQFSHDVAGELSKVTWPSRKETWANTIVVVITSIIAAIILFAFDMTWSSITDLIYKS